MIASKQPETGLEQNMECKTIISVSGDGRVSRQDLQGFADACDARYVHIHDFCFTRADVVLKTSNVRSCIHLVIYAPAVGFVGLAHLQGTAARGFDRAPVNVSQYVRERIARQGIELSAQGIWKDLVMPILGKVNEYGVPYVVCLGGSYGTPGNCSERVHELLLQYKQGQANLLDVLLSPTFRRYQRSELPRCSVRVRKHAEGIAIEERVQLGVSLQDVDMPPRYPGDRQLPRTFTLGDQVWLALADATDFGERSGFWMPCSICNMHDVDATGPEAVAQGRRSADDRLWAMLLELCLRNAPGVFQVDTRVAELRVGDVAYERPPVVLWLARPRKGDRAAVFARLR